MTEQEARTLPLWEVWDYFDKLGKYIETEKYLNTFGTKGSDGLAHDGRNHSDDDHEHKMLRSVLLERCSELVDCTEGHFSINHNLILKISHGEIQAFKDASAIFAFWAWELEQLGKEAKGGD